MYTTVTSDGKVEKYMQTQNSWSIIIHVYIACRFGVMKTSIWLCGPYDFRCGTTAICFLAHSLIIIMYHGWIQHSLLH